MRWFFKSKDGGQESTVTGYWLVEAKRGISIVLLEFDGRSREAFHTHAFGCINWVVRGPGLREKLIDGRYFSYLKSMRPFLISRRDFHKVDSMAGKTWVLSIRGPWSKFWYEYWPVTKEIAKLEEGRKLVDRWPHTDAEWDIE